MATILGLDIGSSTITGAVFSGNQKKFRLIDFFIEEIPPVHTGEYSEDDEYIPPMAADELLAKIMSERNLKDADVVTEVDAKDCIMREISVPFTKDEQIRKTVFFEAENYFTGFDLENTVLDHIKTGESEGSSSLIVSALNHDTIKAHLELLKTASLDPVAVDLDTCALFNAYKSSASYDQEKTTLVVDMGATSTKIVLVEDGKLRKMRSCRLETGVAAAARKLLVAKEAEAAAADEVPVETEESAVDDRLKELEDALDIFEDQATSPTGSMDDLDLDSSAELPLDGSSDAEEESDEPPAADYQGMFPGQVEQKEFNYEEYLARISLEIQRSLAGVSLGSSVERIVITGGMSSREEALAFFTDEFETETVRLRFDDCFEMDPKVAEDPSFHLNGAAAVGLGMRVLREDSIGVDYRKDDFRYEHKFERVKIPLMVAALLVFLFFLQATFWSFHEWKEETKRRQAFAKRNKDIYESFFDEKLRGNAFSALKKKKQAWEGRGAGDVPRFVDFADAMRSFSEVMNDSDVYFTIKSMDFKFRIKSRSVKSSGRGTSTLDSVQPSKVEIEAETASNAQVKLPNQFRTSEASIFTCTASLSGSRAEGKANIPLELQVKQDKLKEYK
ncbi:MAG: pilus assembly protein PilM [Planctomycetota bacterium]|nr:pilus assembly protein PilM [Planctomycetota bacterium]